MEYRYEEPEYVGEAKAFERVSKFGEKFAPQSGKAFIQEKNSEKYAIGMIRKRLRDYTEETTPLYEYIDARLSFIPNVQYYNTDLLVDASVFIYYNPKLTKGRFDKFLEEHPDIVNPKADFLRYVRFLKLRDENKIEIAKDIVIREDESSVSEEEASDVEF